MENNVLGLKITRTSEGFSELLTINGAEYWCKNTRDVRPELDNIADFEKRTYVIMLSRTAGSCLLSVIIPISGRGGDNLCAWINVPDNIRISGLELEAVVESVRKELMKTCMRDDDALMELFSKQYDTDSVKRSMFESSGDKVAYRLYGRGMGYSLDELFDKMNQPYYQGYKCVFFIDSESSARIKVGDDLSGRKLLSQIRIEPLRANDDGFAPYIQEKLFTNPIYVTEGDEIEIVWKKKGYKDIKHRRVLSAGNTDLDYPEFNEYIRLIPYDIFMVQDEKGNQVPEYRLYINSDELQKGGEKEVSEADVHACRVKVSAEGHEEFDETMDLSHPCTISLKKKNYTYRFVVPTKDKSILFDYKSDMRLKCSPLKGYVLTRTMQSVEGVNRLKLKYSPYDKKFWRTAWVVAVIVLCAGIFIGLSLSDMSPSKKTKEEQEVATEDNRKLDRGVHNVATDRSDEVPNESDKYQTPLPETDKGSFSGKPSVKETEGFPKGSTYEHETGRDNKKSDSNRKNQQTDQAENSEDTKRGNDLFNFDAR